MAARSHIGDGYEYDDPVGKRAPCDHRVNYPYGRWVVNTDAVGHGTDGIRNRELVEPLHERGQPRLARADCDAGERIRGNPDPKGELPGVRLDDRSLQRIQVEVQAQRPTTVGNNQNMSRGIASRCIGKKSPVQRVGGAYCAVPFSKPLETAFIPSQAQIETAVRKVLA